MSIYTLRSWLNADMKASNDPTHPVTPDWSLVRLDKFGVRACSGRHALGPARVRL